MKDIIPEKLTYEDLRKRADGFLSTYHPNGTIPVPIEEIIEFQLGINIIPMPGLQKILEVEGFIYGNLKAIAVDESVYTNSEKRYRFTLGHEIGHWYLHKRMYRQY